MTNKASIGAGNIAIDLCGTEIILKPTLQAALTLSGGKGLMPLVDLCRNYDIETITNIICAGYGKRSKDLTDLVFKTGMIKLAPKCILFLHVLANGGQLPAEEAKGEAPASDPLVQESPMQNTTEN